MNLSSVFGVLFFFRDRFITTINVLGDAMGAGIIQHMSGDAITWTRKTDAGDLVSYYSNV